MQSAELTQYAKIRFINGGDTIHASTLVPAGDDYRDASFLRVSTHTTHFLQLQKIHY
jgi:hypothetical protein